MHRPHSIFLALPRCAMPDLRVVLLVLVLAPAWIACQDDSRAGALGVARFAWDSGGLACSSGCDLDEPLALEAQAVIEVVNQSSLPAYDVETSDPTVLSIQPSGVADALAQGLAAGGADLVLRNRATGAVLDRVRIRVDPITRIELDPSFDTTYAYTIMTGGDGRLDFRLYGALGRLVGVGGVTYALAGGLTGTEAGLESATLSNQGFLDPIEEFVRIDARARGAGAVEVRARTGAGALSVAVEFVEPVDATSVSLTGGGTASVGSRRTVRASAWAGSVPIVEPDCNWSLSPSGGTVRIDEIRRELVVLEASAPGAATVTCVVGSAMDSTGVAFVAAGP